MIKRKLFWTSISGPSDSRTFFPRLIKAGTYLTNRGKEFWYATRNKKLLCIELKQGFYKKIILSTNDNELIKNRILEKIRKDFAQR